MPCLSLFGCRQTALRTLALMIVSLCFGEFSLLAQKTLTVGWEGSGERVLLDSIGLPLSKGTSADSDGCVLQLGYYSAGTAENPFAGVFIPLTGESAANSRFRSTSIGDSGNGATGKFSIQCTFEEGSVDSGVNLPSVLTPLVIRFLTRHPSRARPTTMR